MGANSRRRKEKRAERERAAAAPIAPQSLVRQEDDPRALFGRYGIFPSPACPPDIREEHSYIMNAMLSAYDACTRPTGIMAATRAWHACYDEFASALPPVLPSAEDNRVHLRLACEPGCNHCCVLPVVAAPPEVAFIAQLISVKFTQEEKATLKQRMAERKDALRDNISGRHMCALNVDGKCSVYHSRPFNCRMYHSFDVNACVSNFRRGEPVDVPYFPPRRDEPHHIFAASADLVFSGLNIDVRGVDLMDALKIALSTENVLERLAAGEDIFRAARVPI